MFVDYLHSAILLSLWSSTASICLLCLHFVSLSVQRFDGCKLLSTEYIRLLCSVSVHRLPVFGNNESNGRFAEIEFAGSPPQRKATSRPLCRMLRSPRTGAFVSCAVLSCPPGTNLNDGCLLAYPGAGLSSLTLSQTPTTLRE